MLENLYEACGLLATFLGTLFEGEIMLLTSVMSAKLGLFNYYWGLVAGFLGAYTQAWIKYLVARKQGVKLLSKKPNLKKKMDEASVWFDKRPLAILSIYKFLYGMSTIIILMAGLRKISYMRFAIHCGIAIALWVAVVGGLGYFCAEVMMDNINTMADNKWYILGTMLVIGFIAWFVKHRPELRYCLGSADMN